MTDRPESPGDDAVELASRYLDGDLSVDARAAAESDPDVMAWVERFGGMRAALLEPVEIDAAQRTAAIAAALAAADVASTEAAPTPGRDELAAARARRAGRMGKWLGAAAAVAALAIGGVVLAGNSGGDGDDSADEPTFSAEAQIETAAPASETLAESADRSMAADAPTAAVDSTTTGEGDDSAAATTEPSSGGAGSATSVEDDSDEADTETTDAGAAITTAQSAAGPLTFDVPEDLEVLVDAEPVTVPEGRQPPCVDQASGELVAVDVFYADQPAAVYRDGQRLTLTAWAVDSCVVLAEYDYAD